MKYQEFKSGPARSVMMSIGAQFGDAMTAASSYADLRTRIIAINDEDLDCFVRAARERHGTCSRGEKELLKALLVLCDFAHLADELADGEAFTNMTHTGGEFRRAYAACVMHAGY